MSKKRPVYQDVEGSCDPSEVKKARYNPIPESDFHKGKNPSTPRTAVPASRRPLHHDDPQATKLQGCTIFEDASDATMQVHERSSPNEGISLGSPKSSSLCDPRAQGDVPPGGPPVCWYSSEGRRYDQEALQGCNMDCTPVVEGSASELYRTFLARLNWDEPSAGSPDCEEVDVGPTGVSVHLGLQQRRGEAESVKCSFIGRNAELSTSDMVHPDLPVSVVVERLQALGAMFFNELAYAYGTRHTFPPMLFC